MNTATASPTHASASAGPSTNKRVLLASLMGSSIEWFDYFLYATTAALVFGKVFFPTSDPVVGLMLSYLTFSLTFFIRPLGGFIFSHIGDRIGRKKTLVITLSLMGGATVAIGLLPGYDQIGILAPILLILLRLIQGLGIGGEWGGALLLAYEYAPKNRKGLFGSVPQMGVTIGMVLATLAMTVMSTSLSDEQFLSWGWRVPFILSAILVFLGLWIRKGIDETPAFKEAKASGNVAKIPLLETLRYHWRAVLVAIGIKFVETAPFYIFSTFIVSYATSTLAFDRITVLNAVTIATLITTLMIPVMGRLSDTIGRKKMFVGGALLMALFTFPYFILLEQRTTTTLLIATVIGLGLVWAPITAVLGTLFSEIFSTRVRYTGITLGYQVGAALAGGTAPLVATWLLKSYNGSWVPVAWYIVGTVVISLVAISFAKTVADNE